MADEDSNKKIVLIVGKPSTGKSLSLKFIGNPKSVAYFNCDLKELPFKSKGLFAANVSISDPLDLLDYIDECEDNDDIKTYVIDTVTYLMRTFKILYIDEAADSRSAWGLQQKYYNKLMLKLKGSNKNVVVLGHISEESNEDSGESFCKLVLQGAIGKASEGDYTTILEAKSKVINKKITKVSNELLTYSDWEKEDGIKYLFVTRKTKANPLTLARSADDLWDRDMLYINNDIQQVIERLEDYYD